MTKKAEAVTDIVSVDTLEEGFALRLSKTMVLKPTIAKKTVVGKTTKASRAVKYAKTHGIAPALKPKITVYRMVRKKFRETLGDARSVVTIRSDDPLVTQAVADVVGRVTEIVESRREALSQQNIDVLVDAYLKSEPTAPVRHDLELDNARERARFIGDHVCYTSK